MSADAKGVAKSTAKPPARNGSIFLTTWEEDGGYFVWRGGVDRPFRRLRAGAIQSGTPCVSPDGRRLAYIRSRTPDIVVRRVKPRSDQLGPPRVIGRLPIKRQSSPGSWVADCAWSPGGGSLVLAGDGKIGRRWVGAVWRLDIDGSRLRQLVEVPDDPGGIPTDPAWSSTGRIAFLDVGWDDEFGWITLVDADGANFRRLKHHGLSLAWSPNGQTLAFIREKYMEGPVMLADADGANARRLRGGQYGAVAFSPNGRRMAFARTNNVDPNPSPDGRIEIARNDGTTIQSVRVHDWRSMLRLTWTRAPNR